jgi:hypothetical protein
VKARAEKLSQDTTRIINHPHRWIKISSLFEEELSVGSTNWLEIRAVNWEIISGTITHLLLVSLTKFRRVLSIPKSSQGSMWKNYQCVMPSNNQNFDCSFSMSDFIDYRSQWNYFRSARKEFFIAVQLSSEANNVSIIHKDIDLTNLNHEMDCVRVWKLSSPHKSKFYSLRHRNAISDATGYVKFITLTWRKIILELKNKI